MPATPQTEVRTTPLTKEAMAELLELHRAGQQADREAEASYQADLLRSMLAAHAEKNHEWVRTFITNANAQLAKSVSEQVAREMSERFISDRRLRVKIDNLLQWSYVKATILLGLVVAIFLPVFVLVYGMIVGFWAAVFRAMGF